MQPTHLQNFPFQLVKVLGSGLSFIWAVSCTPAPETPIDAVLASSDPVIQNVLNQAEDFEVQIAISRIHRTEDSVSFEDFSYRLDDSTYYYPASTVKFPAAVLALEKLRSLAYLDRNSPFFVEGDSVETTMTREIDKIFAVSDNEAYNRLFEFLGPDYMNRRLLETGIGPVRLSHRLSVEDAANPQCTDLIFRRNDTVLYRVPGTVNAPVNPLGLRKTNKGDGYYEGDSLIEKPMDFSLKNYLPLGSLHNLMKRVVFPEAFPKSQQFTLADEDRAYLLKAMETLPRDAGYDPAEYPDNFVKYYVIGTKDSLYRKPETLHILNKVGFAYGYLTDCSYLKDDTTGAELLITTTIHVNKDRIFNDNVYEYDSVGIPFLAALGQTAMDWEAAN